MNKQDKYIQEVFKQDKQVSDKVNKIFEDFENEACKTNLRNKKEVKNNVIGIRRIAAIAASFMIVFLLGFSVYAMNGGKIFGKPAIEWLGIKFSDEYQELVVAVENQALEKDGIKVELISAMCDEGYLVLEFDVFLEEEARKKLGIDKTINDLGLSFNNELIKDDNGNININSFLRK